jgi:hypothetical protein
MTPRTSHLLALFTIAAATLVPSLRAEPPKPCALLTPLQIKAVVSTPLLAGKPGSPTDGTTDCTWSDAKGETRVYVSLNDPGVGYKSFRDAMLATGKLVPLSGLAGDAFFVSSAGNSAALYVLKNKHLLLVTVNGVNFTKAQNESAEQTLATQILPKL